MVKVSLTHAKARLSVLLDQVEAGEEVVITRRDRAVAQLVSVARPRDKLPIPFAELAAFRATMPGLSRPSADLLRALRDEDL